MKIRTIITQDAEVDDRNSLRHFLFYANEVELLGIVQTSSKFHWQGIPGAVKPKREASEYEFMGEINGPYDQPYRWPGTDWMFEVCDDYAKDYPNLIKHADGYPTPEYLRTIVKIGNIGYEGEMEASTEGSELIKGYILDDDERPLYLQVWGGTNTIARALLDIQNEYENTPEWPALHEKISKKVIMTACGEQDPTYRSYIAQNWPDMQFVKTLQMRSYAYPWFVMPEGESKDTLRGKFMKEEILNGKSALAGGYCTWHDGIRYPGEGEKDQFGTNPNIANEWFGAKMGLPAPEKYDFLSEGDSPTFFLLFDWGFRTLEDFGFGGIAGRYHRVEDQFNEKGQPLNVWDVSMDSYTDRDGNVSEQESMWPYVADIQRDFAARIDWTAADAYEKAEHRPSLVIEDGLDIQAGAGSSVMIRAKAVNPDGGKAAVTFHIYKEASAASADRAVLSVRANEEASETDAQALVQIPDDAASGDRIHVIVKAQGDGHHRLCYYQQVIVTVI